MVFPDFNPTIPGVLESAPAYQPLLKVTAVPVLFGCVYSVAKDQCKCYTQQATPYPASKGYCLETVKNHRFNPYYERAEPKESFLSPPVNTKPVVNNRISLPVQEPVTESSVSIQDSAG